MNILQLQVIELSEEDVLPLCLLEGILCKDSLNLPEALTRVNGELYRFGTKNLWYGFTPVSLLE